MLRSRAYITSHFGGVPGSVGLWPVPEAGETLRSQGKAIPHRGIMALQALRCRGPVHTIQHDLLKRWGLKTPRIMAEQ
jgi:hypothetical protein